jgi:hypothetical protein
VSIDPLSQPDAEVVEESNAVLTKYGDPQCMMVGCKQSAIGVARSKKAGYGAWVCRKCAQRCREIIDALKPPTPGAAP